MKNRIYFGISTLAICALMISGCSNPSTQTTAVSPSVPPTSTVSQTPQPSPSLQPSESSSQKKDERWSWISRSFMVQGDIIKLDAGPSTVKSLTIKVTGNMVTPNNPVDYDYKGKTLDIYFEFGMTDSKAIKKIQPGTPIVISFQQAALPDGKIVFGSDLRNIYLIKGKDYIDLQGSVLREDQLQ